MQDAKLVQTLPDATHLGMRSLHSRIFTGNSRKICAQTRFHGHGNGGPESVPAVGPAWVQQADTEREPAAAQRGTWRAGLQDDAAALHPLDPLHACSLKLSSRGQQRLVLQGEGPRSFM